MNKGGYNWPMPDGLAVKMKNELRPEQFNRACRSAGRSLRSQRRGREFKSRLVHSNDKMMKFVDETYPLARWLSDNCEWFWNYFLMETRTSCFPHYAFISIQPFSPARRSRLVHLYCIGHLPDFAKCCRWTRLTHSRDGYLITASGSETIS